MPETYVIRTNLPPEMVNAIGMMVFAKWVDFAMGRSTLNGKRIMYPTGRYASSISYRREGEASVAIIADEGHAPEAGILEHGHGPVDLKTRLRHGRAYPMHRPIGSTPGTSLRRIGSGPPSMKPQLWAEVRMREFSGFASIGPNSSPGSWIIPAMTPYAPAMIFAAQLRAALKGS